MRILITGGAGFIGSHIADACIEAGHEVLVVDDLSTGRRENVPADAAFVECDIREAGQVERAFAVFKPEAVSHQAAQTSVSVSTREAARDAAINVLGSINVIESSVQHAVGHFVFASTGGAIYGEVPDGVKADLDSRPSPQSPYACSKFAVENYLNAYHHEFGLRSTILRYANVYGPRQDPHGEAGVVAIFNERSLAGEPMSVFARKEEGDAGCVRDYVYVGDVVRANMAAIGEALETAMINVCTGEATTTLALAETIKSLNASASEIGFGPRREGDVERSVLDPGDPCPIGERISLAEGLGLTSAWFKARHI